MIHCLLRQNERSKSSDIFVFFHSYLPGAHNDAQTHNRHLISIWWLNEWVCRKTVKSSLYLTFQSYKLINQAPRLERTCYNEEKDAYSLGKIFSYFGNKSFLFSLIYSKGNKIQKLWRLEFNIIIFRVLDWSFIFKITVFKKYF